MSADEEEAPVARRIVVTLDASACGRAALETAAELAAQMQAELWGLFVEDVALLRLANLPLASEVALPCAVPRPLEPVRLQHALRLHAERVRQAVAEAAGRRQLRWSFQVLQGDVVRTSRTLAEQAELLILGWAEMVASGMSAGATRAATGSILVIDEGPPAGDRVLRAAAALAQLLGSELLVLHPEGSGEADAARHRQRAGLLAAGGIRFALQPLAKLAAKAIVAAAERLRSRLVLLVLGSELLSESEVDILVKQLECPLVLVP